MEGALQRWFEQPLEEVTKILYGESSISVKEGRMWYQDDNIYILLVKSQAEAVKLTEEQYENTLADAAHGLLQALGIRDNLVPRLQAFKNVTGVNYMTTLDINSKRIVLKVFFNVARPSKLVLYPLVNGHRCSSLVDDTATLLLLGRPQDALTRLEAFIREFRVDDKRFAILRDLKHLDYMISNARSLRDISSCVEVYGQALTAAKMIDRGSPLPFVFDQLRDVLITATQMTCADIGGVVVFRGYEEQLRQRMGLTGSYFCRNPCLEGEPTAPWIWNTYHSCPFDICIAPFRYFEDASSRAAIATRIANMMMTLLYPRDQKVILPTSDHSPRQVRLRTYDPADNNAERTASFEFTSTSHQRRPATKIDNLRLDVKDKIAFESDSVTGHMVSLGLDQHRLANFFFFRHAYNDSALLGTRDGATVIMPILALLTQFLSFYRRPLRNDEGQGDPAVGAMIACLLRARRCIKWLTDG